METKIEEIWKDVVGYKGKYKISHTGRVLSISRKHPKGKILNQHQYRGYWIVRLCDKSGKTHRVHKLVATAFIPNPENKPCINHKNGMKHDNHVENLEWSTFSENLQHAYDMGLKNPINGTKCNLTKLTGDIVLRIRHIWASDNRPLQREIADNFNITQVNVSLIIRRKTWAHI